MCHLLSRLGIHIYVLYKPLFELPKETNHHAYVSSIKNRTCTVMYAIFQCELQETITHICYILRTTYRFGAQHFLCVINQQHVKIPHTNVTSIYLSQIINSKTTV